MRGYVVQIVAVAILALFPAGVTHCLGQGSKTDAGADGAREQAVATSGAPSGYSVLASSGVGRTLFAPKPDIRSAKAGVLAALRDLGQVFEGRPVVGGAFGDAGDKQCGGSFTAKLKGQAIKGFVACGVGADGAGVTVVYDRANAAASESSALLGAVPASSSSQWVVHPLAGGSGTLKLPPNWKIRQSTPIGGVLAEGPAGQRIGLGLGAGVTSPTAPLAAQLRAAGSVLVAPYSDPVTAFKTLSPQLSAMSERHGEPPFFLTRIISTSPAQAQLPTGQAAWIECAYTLGRGNSAVEYRQKMLFECYPVGPMGWGFSASYATAPQRIYDRDAPLMKEIAQSWTLNSAAIGNNSASMINAQNRAFASFENSMRERNKAFEGLQQSMRNSELAREKSNADFDEIIRGYRIVEDTQTGDRTDVNLGYSKQIVDKLNEGAGFQRYKEIPLRDR